MTALANKIITRKIYQLPELLSQVRLWQEQNQCIVFTNGCFDWLHKGHIGLLAQAKAYGDKLIVGLNSDASVKRLKGTMRPIADQESRSWVIAALSMVDAVILFNTDTPLSIIQSIKPNVLVKGGDYQKNNIVGAKFMAQNSGEVKIIPLISNYSTSTLLRKKQEITNSKKDSENAEKQ